MLVNFNPDTPSVTPPTTAHTKENTPPASEQREAAPAIRKRFDNYEKSQEMPDGKSGSPELPDDSGKKPTTCTVNTDQVELELRKLKAERNTIQQQLQSASGNPDQTAQLEQRLSSLEAEIKAKDTDTYKRQHAKVSYEE